MPQKNWEKETGLVFNIYKTQSKSLCRKFPMMDKEKFYYCDTDVKYCLTYDELNDLTKI